MLHLHPVLMRAIRRSHLSCKPGVSPGVEVPSLSALSIGNGLLVEDLGCLVLVVPHLKTDLSQSHQHQPWQDRVDPLQDPSGFLYVSCRRRRQEVFDVRKLRNGIPIPLCSW